MFASAGNTVVRSTGIAVIAVDGNMHRITAIIIIGHYNIVFSHRNAGPVDNRTLCVFPGMGIVLKQAII
jgi:hypothetical protein